MFDLEEYLLNLREQEKACRGMADSIDEMVRCLEKGEVWDGQMSRAFLRNGGYRVAFHALSAHAECLWNMS